jgi:hypothetical protein
MRFPRVRTKSLFILLITLLPAAIHAASLDPATLKAWEEYIESANGRMEQRLSPGNVFLWVDEEPERLAKVREGQIVVSPVGPQNPMKAPSGLIHDWVGATFIPDVTLPDVLQVVRDYGRYKEIYLPTVIDSRVMDTGETKDRFSMLLIHKSSFLKTALDADYETYYVHVDDRRLYSISRATRIQEVAEYGPPTQRMLPEGEGKGIIWRLFSVTRYAERDGGVYVEFEAIGLSRDIPASLRWIVEPVVRRTSRASLSTSLRQTQAAVRSRAVNASAKTPEARSGASLAR